MDIFAPFMLTPAQVALFMIVVPITTGLTAVIRALFTPPKPTYWQKSAVSRVLPLVSVLLAVLLSYAVGIVASTPAAPIGEVMRVLIGLVMGLAASGLWSGGKALSGR